MVAGGRARESVDLPSLAALYSRDTNPPTPRQTVDFGWCLSGKLVRIVPDSSLSLQIARQGAHAVLLDQYCGDRDSLKSCLQCGINTATCEPARSDGALYPLRHPHDATRDGIFFAGCATGMKPTRNCMIDGAGVAARVTALLQEARE